ncbi:MAG: hypothetical protein NC388_08620 [Clostridium sp.]|nr:hypothetical protein [Clostridium sp.]
MNARRRFPFYVIVGLVLLSLTAMTQPDKERPRSQSRIIMLHTDVLTYDEYKHPGVQILIGNVVLKHDSVVMYCDSACFYEQTNSFDAYNNVRMVQGDTLELVGDVLYYSGLEQMARVRNNVVLTHRNSVLYTDSLDYDRLYDLGYFFDGGRLVDGDNVLTSDWGEYCPTTHEAVFNYNVRLTNPTSVLVSDTLHYNTESGIAHIVGPSNIDNGDNHIYSELGYYDTKTDKAYLLDRSIITNKGKKIVGDSVFYDNERGIGEAFDHVVYTDEINKNALTGHYCFYNEKTGYALATDSAVVIDYSQKDTLYMHADSMKLYTFHMDTDSMYREIRAYNKVRAYRVDMQAVCDSLVFNSKDSCLTLYKDPIIWNQGQQLLGEEIRAYMNDSTIDSIHVVNQALMVEQVDSVHFNQIAGREMKSYFRNGDIDWTWVIGNVLVNYFVLDDDSLITMMNYTETSELKLYMLEGKMDHIWMPSAEGTFYPLALLPPDKLYLPTYAWFDYIRPTDKDDIFHWRPKQAGTELKTTVRRQPPLQQLDKVRTSGK